MILYLDELSDLFPAAYTVKANFAEVDSASGNPLKAQALAVQLRDSGLVFGSAALRFESQREVSVSAAKTESRYGSERG